MEIKQYNYRRPRHLARNIIEEIDSIAVHHTGAYKTINDYTDWHIDGNKCSWLGYGYVIMEDGTIYQARGYKYTNAAVQYHNSHIVSIALNGNFDKSEPTPLQLESLAYLIDYLKKECRNINTVAGHNKWNHTSCPGRNFTLNNLDKYKRNFMQKDNEIEELKKELEETKQHLGQLQSHFYALDRKVDRILSMVDRKLAKVLK